MAWCRQATSHYLSQCWPNELTKQKLYISSGVLAYALPGRQDMALTHCHLVTVIWHQAITWINVDLSSLRSSHNHLRAVSLETQPSITKITLKITYQKFQSNLPGTNQLINHKTKQPLKRVWIFVFDLSAHLSPSHLTELLLHLIRLDIKVTWQL